MTETPSSTTDLESGDTTSDDATGPGDDGSGSPAADKEPTDTDGPPTNDGNGAVLPDGTDLVDIAYKGTFGVLLLLGLYATVQAYMSASHAIDIWIALEYQPIFQAAFNVGVVLACGIGLSVLLRRVR